MDCTNDGASTSYELDNDAAEKAVCIWDFLKKIEPSEHFLQHPDFPENAAKQYRELCDQHKSLLELVRIAAKKRHIYLGRIPSEVQQLPLDELLNIPLSKRVYENITKHIAEYRISVENSANA